MAAGNSKNCGHIYFAEKSQGRGLNASLLSTASTQNIVVFFLVIA